TFTTVRWFAAAICKSPSPPLATAPRSRSVCAGNWKKTSGSNMNGGLQLSAPRASDCLRKRFRPLAEKRCCTRLQARFHSKNSFAVATQAKNEPNEKAFLCNLYAGKRIKSGSCWRIWITNTFDSIIDERDR